jgi:DNA repair exonuclease SbcCD ATPase subunit
MTSTQYKATATSFLLLVMIATPCLAQFGGVRGGRGAYSRNVVLQRTAGLSDPMMRLVANELARSLQKRMGQRQTGDLQELYLMPAAEDGFGGGFQGPESLQIRSLGVQVHVGDEAYDETLAERQWDNARQKLQDALRAAQRRMIEREVEAYQRKRDSLAAKLQETKQRINDTISSLEALGAEDSISELRKQLVSTTAMLRELELDRVSAQARREAIVQRIDELREASAKASDSDPLTAELEKIEGIRARQLQGVRDLHAAGQTSASELNEAETEMARARVELLKAKRAATAEAAGGVLHELNNELSHLIVRLAEIDARTKALKTSLDKLRDATSIETVAQREELDETLEMLQEQLATLTVNLSKLESDGAPAPEEITIMPLDEALSLGNANEGDESGGDGNGDDNAPQNE